MEEFFSSLIKGFRERNKSGVWFTVLLCWCIYYWEIVVIILWEPNSSFGKHSLVDLIKMSYKPNDLWIPIVYSFLITLFMPYIHAGVSWYNRLAFRVREKWVLSAENYNGPVSPDRLIDLLNIVKIEKDKNKQAKLDYDELKRKYEEIYKEKTDNFNDYNHKSISPLKDQIQELTNTNENLLKSQREIVSKFAPFQNKIDLICISIIREEYGSNLLGFFVPLIDNKHLLVSKYESKNTSYSYISIQNETIYIDKIAHKVIASKTHYNPTTNVDETHIFIENKRKQGEYTLLIIFMAHGYYCLTFYNYFDSSMDVPTVFLGKLTAN